MGFVASKRVFELLDTPSLEENTGQLKDLKINGDISFENVDFSYVKDVQILKKITFHIAAGQSLAIVGATGSGKTSIINILNRFYPFQSGTIAIDNRNIIDYDLDFLRSQIAMVLQDVYLFLGALLII